ncbi:hypothetical protein JW835_04020 [bacterium]|nr:hypothetical protein [bacterium]RQV97961.1 MAG: hypothetical protein EH221_03115 [bacterium]
MPEKGMTDRVDCTAETWVIVFKSLGQQQILQSLRSFRMTKGFSKTPVIPSLLLRASLSLRRSLHEAKNLNWRCIREQCNLDFYEGEL